MSKKCENCIHEKVCGVLFPNNCPFYCEEPKQEELTLEKAIDYLTEIGWLPEHDRILTERPHGEWIWNTDNHYAQRRYCKCSICGIGMGNTEYDFCPNCGADMRKEGDEE